MKRFEVFIKKYNEIPYEDIESHTLCRYYSKDFDLWFDKNTFDYKYYSYSLCSYYSEHFDTWFDKDKFNFDNCSDSLFYYCSEHLTDDLIWNCKDKINWQKIDSKIINDSLKMKLKIAGYI